jgi:glucose-6-phosphate 1-dehydrogenase
VPHEPFHDRDRPNVLRFRLSPDAISLRLNVNGAGDPFDLEQVLLDTEFPAQDLPPYSLLLKEILLGDPTLSIRGESSHDEQRRTLQSQRDVGGQHRQDDGGEPSGRPTHRPRT